MNNQVVSPLNEADFNRREDKRLVEYCPLVPYDDLISDLEKRLGSESPLIVVLDFSDRLWPYREDQHSLVEAMQFAWPTRDISFRIFNRGPHGGWTDWVEEQQLIDLLQPQAWIPPSSPETQILIVSDLGLLSEISGIIKSWEHFVRGFFRDVDRDTDFNVVVLTPHGHDVSGRIRDENLIAWNETKEKPTICSGTRLGLEDLLGMAAVLRRIDPPLLREMRRLLPVNGACDAGLEGVFWSCSHVDAGQVAGLQSIQRAIHLNRFRTLPEDTQRAIFSLFSMHHAHLPVALYWEEVISFRAHAAEAVLADSVVASEIAKAMLWLRRLWATSDGEEEINKRCKSIASGIITRADPKMRELLGSELNQ